jgi:GNAT superfamily N-acetyltransferase
VATASPLVHQHEEFAEPFVKAGYRPEEIFYFGESVLLPEYRGQGAGHRFFDGREAHAESRGYRKTAFCAVIRPDDHPLKSPDIRPLDSFWRKRGYEKLDGLIAHFSWRDIGEAEETEKPMQYWGRGF